MTPLFLPSLGLGEDWLVPVIGMAACAVAFLVGWLLLASRPSKKVLAPDSLLDASFLQGVTTERRAAPRRKGNAVEVQLRGPEGPTIRAWVQDRSVGGLCLLVDQAVAEKSILEVRPSATASTMGWVEITVRSCRLEGTQYELGCQFTKMPNWHELLKFG
jgi:hypothetical protein